MTTLVPSTEIVSPPRGSAMPAVAPLYPPPPVHYSNAKLVLGMGGGTTPPGVVPESLDAGAGGLHLVLFADYPESSIGPYGEVVVLVSASLGETQGLFCPLIYVTSETALCQGREVWGFPKKLADIDVQVGDGGEVSCSLTRRGEVLISLTGRAVEPGDKTAAAAMGALPVFNRKLIPGAGGGAPDFDMITSSTMSADPHRVTTGSGEWSCAGEIAAVIGECAPVQLVSMVADCVLSEGKLEIGG